MTRTDRMPGQEPGEGQAAGCPAHAAGPDSAAELAMIAAGSAALATAALVDAIADEAVDLTTIRNLVAALRPALNLYRDSNPTDWNAGDTDLLEAVARWQDDNG